MVSIILGQCGSEELKLGCHCFENSGYSEPPRTQRLHFVVPGPAFTFPLRLKESSEPIVCSFFPEPADLQSSCLDRQSSDGFVEMRTFNQGHTG